MAPMTTKPEQTAAAPGVTVPTLAVPCTLVQLRAWIDQQVAPVRPGSAANAVTATASAISVA
jgi:hypothetical protein